MISSVVALDKALRSSAALTPTPTWAMEQSFVLPNESSIRLKLLEAERIVENAQKQKEQLSEALLIAGQFRNLLFEKGKPLEVVIIDALRLFGFVAESFKDSSSEFDVIFESSNGRLIGEAEGKDNKPINIDKLRQLSMNIHEDLQRDDVLTPAKAVLFGNGFRLQPLQDRLDPFTDKCLRAASTSSTALVFTPDMFPPVQYLLEAFDGTYAEACRQAILQSIGRVVFPTPPPKGESVDEVSLLNRGDNSPNEKGDSEAIQ